MNFTSRIAGFVSNCRFTAAEVSSGMPSFSITNTDTFSFSRFEAFSAPRIRYPTAPSRKSTSAMLTVEIM